MVTKNTGLLELKPLAGTTTEQETFQKLNSKVLNSEIKSLHDSANPLQEEQPKEENLHQIYTIPLSQCS